MNGLSWGSRSRLQPAACLLLTTWAAGMMYAQGTVAGMITAFLDWLQSREVENGGPDQSGCPSEADASASAARVRWGGHPSQGAAAHWGASPAS